MADGDVGNSKILATYLARTPRAAALNRKARDLLPEYMLIHDRRDGACWLWGFEHGLRFVEATDPVMEPEESGLDGAQNPKLLGP